MCYAFRCNVLCPAADGLETTAATSFDNPVCDRQVLHLQPVLLIGSLVDSDLASAGTRLNSVHCCRAR